MYRGFVDQTVKVTSDTFVGGIFRRDYTPKKAVSVCEQAR